MQGCDASVLLDTADPNSATEKFGIPNLSLRGFDVIDIAKARIEKECGNAMSYADIVAFSGRDATYFLRNKKVYFDVPARCYDGRVSLVNKTLPNLPPPFARVDQLKVEFASKGLNTNEMVTLSGAYTIGISHCSSFSDHLTSNTSDMDPKLKKHASRGVQVKLWQRQHGGSGHRDP
jgi:peroxidase